MKPDALKQADKDKQYKHAWQEMSPRLRKQLADLGIECELPKYHYPNLYEIKENVIDEEDGI